MYVSIKIEPRNLKEKFDGKFDEKLAVNGI